MQEASRGRIGQNLRRIRRTRQTARRDLRSFDDGAEPRIRARPHEESDIRRLHRRHAVPDHRCDVCARGAREVGVEVREPGPVRGHEKLGSVRRAQEPVVGRRSSSGTGCRRQHDAPCETEEERQPDPAAPTPTQLCAQTDHDPRHEPNLRPERDRRYTMPAPDSQGYQRPRARRSDPRAIADRRLRVVTEGSRRRALLDRADRLGDVEGADTRGEVGAGGRGVRTGVAEDDVVVRGGAGRSVQLGPAKPRWFWRAVSMRAHTPSANGHERLVPPTTWGAPPTYTFAALFGSASIATSGTARPQGTSTSALQGTFVGGAIPFCHAGCCCSCLSGRPVVVRACSSRDRIPRLRLWAAGSLCVEKPCGSGRSCARRGNRSAMSTADRWMGRSRRDRSRRRRSLRPHGRADRVWRTRG
jgi:hypothetical protein